MTYSIVATDPETGSMGVAVQSHWFSVGGLVTWGEPGVGVVATQANVDVGYGPRALDLLRQGAGATDALAELIGRDELRHVRQVAVGDAQGAVAVHTGEGCMDFAGHTTGAGMSCQGNLMADPSVWHAMAAAFSAAGGDLATRLLAALDAGEAAGGDVRGRQSAALLIVPATGDPWDTAFDLRIEDHPEPLSELRRLVGLQRAYAMAGEGDRLTGEGDHVAAAAQYRGAFELAPECIELEFWAGLSMVATEDDPELGLEHVRTAVQRHGGWGELLRRLGPQDAPAAAQVARRLDLTQ